MLDTPRPVLSDSTIQVAEASVAGRSATSEGSKNARRREEIERLPRARRRKRCRRGGRIALRRSPSVLPPKRSAIPTHARDN